MRKNVKLIRLSNRVMAAEKQMIAAVEPSDRKHRLKILVQRKRILDRAMKG